MLQDSRQPVQPLGGLPTQAANQSLCLAEYCCWGTLRGPLEVAELGWGDCGCPPPPHTLQGRGHSARSPEPFGSSSARKAIGDEHVPVPVAGTEDLVSTLSLRGPHLPPCVRSPGLHSRASPAGEDLRLGAPVTRLPCPGVRQGYTRRMGQRAGGSVGGRPSGPPCAPCAPCSEACGSSVPQALNRSRLSVPAQL